ncbi:cell envelope biogenesis protein OmpA [Rhizobium sp. SL42]|uniref:cell envelope biogenesis protein OmpA n=1 Tax=Rhizobium sp. SL42 TaxID=2806346 RepID=UPI001F194574|nr:cell envelope biogenesis protein OmpA [Rhizobium sp. SL42]UJW74314.1 cell envelope biogenesis protein OmpA [Rhizobium sp. SL42]
MFETAFALSLTQFARTFSTPERLQRRPARNAALEPWRMRNTGLDALFYDVKSLSAEETFYISDALASEGLIMIVPPADQGMLTICDSVEEYRLRGGRNVHALAVAGIGGSAIGAAAFARNVANAIDAPVAAVVSGYGLGDIVNEAIGGAFFFGWLGHVRSNLEVIDDLVGRPKLGAYGKRDADTESVRSTGLDTDTVATLLADPEFSFSLLAGHSRGNRVLADALQSMTETAPARLETLANKARIVTFGGRIKMPEIFTDVVDVVGELDWFGEINSRPKIKTDIRVPLCGHSTNTDIAGALQVTKVLKDILGAASPSAAELKEIEPQVVEAETQAAPAVPDDEPAPIELAPLASAETAPTVALMPDVQADDDVPHALAYAEPPFPVVSEAGPVPMEPETSPVLATPVMVTPEIVKTEIATPAKATNPAPTAKPTAPARISSARTKSKRSPPKH